MNYILYKREQDDLWNSIFTIATNQINFHQINTQLHTDVDLVYRVDQNDKLIVLPCQLVNTTCPIDEWSFNMPVWPVCLWTLWTVCQFSVWLCLTIPKINKNPLNEVPFPWISYSLITLDKIDHDKVVLLVSVKVYSTNYHCFHKL